jgi:hypothetical protein
MHISAAAPGRELAHLGRHRRFIGQVQGQLADHMAQPVQLALLLDIAGAAGVLDLLVLVEHVQHAFGLAAVGIPDLDRKDHRTAARLVVQHRLDRRIGIDAAIPVRLAVDAHRRKRRRQRARRHHVRGHQRLLAAVEIAHRAGARVDRADREPHMLVVDVIEIDQRVDGAAQRAGLIKGRVLDADPRIGIPPRRQVRFKESGYALPDGHGVGDGARHGRKSQRVLLHAVPELAQAVEPVLRRVAGDDGAVDGAYRGADHPVRLQAGFVHGLVHAQLVGAQRAAALQDQDDLARQGRGSRTGRFAVQVGPPRCTAT